jgi:GNAT superfamily N-acetyltransferase
MEIREANINDRMEIVDLHIRSQAATRLPDPELIAPEALGNRLYAREAIKRYVAVDVGRIVGHGLIEVPNPRHMKSWRSTSVVSNRPMIELGAAFTDPELAGRGVWTALLKHRLQVVRDYEAIPVAATWTQNEHVKRTFLHNNAVEAGVQPTSAGNVSLFVFQ